jgi:hypothetical protein
LIGGIVGGIVALLLIGIGGLIVCLVARSRRRGKDEPNNGAQLQSVDGAHDDLGASQHNNFDTLPQSPPRSNYGVIVPPQNYDAWSAANDNNYAKPSPNSTDYEDFTKIE